MLSECDAINAYRGNNHSPLLWQFYKSHRSAFFRLINAIGLESTSTDLTLIKAIQFLKNNAHRRGNWLSGEVDLSFASVEWQKFVTFYRSDKNTTYQHIDSLFSDSINWKLIETHWQDLFRVVLSISTG